MNAEFLPRRWTSDGTPEGAARVKDVRSGTNDSYPRDISGVDGTLFFSAENGSGDRELWRSDRTEEGAVRVKEIRLGSV